MLTVIKGKRMMNPPVISRRAYAVTLFLILLVCYGYFLPKWADWGANSRADLVYAVGDQGVLNIDAYHENTGDKACYPGPYDAATNTCTGHYYTDKSLGPSLVALPFYMVFKGVAALPPVQKFIQSGKGLGSMEDTLNPNGKGIRPEAVYQYMALAFISFFAISIPSALLGVVVFLMAARFASKDSYAFLLGLVYGLATIAFPYSNVLYQHQMAAFGAFVGFYLLWRVIYEDASLRWLWIVGLLFSLTVITEYPVVPVLAILFIWAAVKLPNRMALWRVVVAAIPLGLLFAAYNYLTFHTPIPAGYEYSTNWQDVHQIGFMSLTVPSLKTFLELTISTYRGIFFLSPVLLLSIPGFVFMWRESKYRAETIVLALICIFFFLYNSSSAMWAGGDTVGPRYLTPMVPFLILPTIFVFNRWLKSRIGVAVIAVLIALSVFNVWVQTIGGQAFPPYYTEGGSAVRNPLFDYSLPLFLKGNIARNYGQIIGLRGFLSLLPLLVACVALYVVVPRIIGRRETAGSEIALKQAAGTD
jgi:4-amino-4-deoxy-L-arabinose transferase-like glycosyltransferase